MEIAEKADNEVDRLDKIGQFIDEPTSQAQPEIEKFPIHYYEDGIDSVRFSLHSNQLIAFQHWNGNKDYTTRDAISDMIKSS